MFALAYSVEKLECPSNDTSKPERCSQSPPKCALFSAHCGMGRTLFPDLSELCPSLEFFNKIGSKQPFAAPTTKVCCAERLCENYRELLQMAKIARFGRALVERNHQIRNSRKRAARNHEESRVFTQPPDEAAIYIVYFEGRFFCFLATLKCCRKRA